MSSPRRPSWDVTLRYLLRAWSAAAWGLWDVFIILPLAGWCESDWGLKEAGSPWCGGLAQARAPLSKGIALRLSEVQLGREIARDLHASLRLLDVGLQPFVHVVSDSWSRFHGRQQRGMMGSFPRATFVARARADDASSADRAYRVPRLRNGVAHVIGAIGLTRTHLCPGAQARAPSR